MVLDNRDSRKERIVYIKHCQRGRNRKLLGQFGIAASTLNDRCNGRKSRWEAHQDQQKLPPSVERALKKWCQDMYDSGFPPRVDLLRRMATALARKIAEEEHFGPDSAHIGRNWVIHFLDRHTDFSAKYSTQLYR